MISDISTYSMIKFLSQLFIFQINLGYSLGSIIGGFIYKAYGGSIMYRSFSCLAVVSAFFHAFLYTKYFKHSVEKPTTGKAI